VPSIRRTDVGLKGEEEEEVTPIVASWHLKWRRGSSKKKGVKRTASQVDIPPGQQTQKKIRDVSHA